MTVQFTYTPDDMSEAIKANAAFFANTQKGSPDKPGGATSKLGRGVFGWVLFVALAAMLSYLLGSGRHPRGVSPKLEPPEQFTHNFLLTLVSSCIGPILLTAFMAWVTSTVGGPTRVPFYTPTAPPRKRWQMIWRWVAWVGLLAGLADIAVFAFLPSQPDWRPNIVTLLFVVFMPWLAWFLLLTLALSQARRFGAKGVGHEENSMRLEHHLEASAVGLTCGNILVRYEYSWGYFVSYLESDHLLILFTRDLAMKIIPKRAFPDSTSLTEFFALVSNHVPEGRFLSRPSAFPVIAVSPIPVLPFDNAMIFRGGIDET